jgi:hypothetical protein
VNLIRITGSREILLELEDVADLDIARHSDRQIDENTFSISAYASDDAIAEIEGRGATVEVVMDTDARSAYLAENYERLSDEDFRIV